MSVSEIGKVKPNCLLKLSNIIDVPDHQLLHGLQSFRELRPRIHGSLNPVKISKVGPHCIVIRDNIWQILKKVGK